MSVSAVLLGLILVASLSGLLLAPTLIERSLFRPYCLLPRRQYATIVTSAFMHANLAHLAFNVITFWSFGFPLERAMGSARFAALYVSGVLVSDWGTWLKHRTDPAYACLGASGAILAVLFASIVYFPTQSLYLMLLPVPIPAPLFAVGYLGYTWYASRRLRGRVNHDAHFGGAIAGLLFVAITDPDAWRRTLALLLG
jgi:membrane associated rhomboid family serine protease